MASQAFERMHNTLSYRSETRYPEVKSTHDRLWQAHEAEGVRKSDKRFLKNCKNLNRNATVKNENTSKSEVIRT